MARVMTGAQLPETENVPGKTKKSRTSGASKSASSSKAAGAARVSRKAKAAGASKKNKASRDSGTPVKKNKLKAASADKAHATKVKKVKKTGNRVGLISFIKNRKAGKAMSRSEKLWLEIVLGTIAAIYFGGAIFFHFHFLPKSQINGVDVSLNSVETAKQKMVDHTSQYELTLIPWRQQNRRWSIIPASMN